MRKLITSLLLLVFALSMCGFSSRKETTEISGRDVIVAFVEEYNAVANEKLTFVEEFAVPDRSSGHYRTEFRLTAYKEAVGMSYSLGDASVDIVQKKTSFTNENRIRVYAENASFIQCCDIIRIASPIMDPDISADELQATLEYLEKHKSANGHYYADLGMLLLGSEVKGYELMLKMGND